MIKYNYILQISIQISYKLKQKDKYKIVFNTGLNFKLNKHKIYIIYYSK